MNKIQKAVILLGVMMILLMGLYPPWIHTASFEKGYPKDEKASSYGYIFAPPKEPSGPQIEKYIVMDSGLDKDAKREELSKFWKNYHWGVILDTPRLLVQWAMVIFTVTGLCLIFNNKN